MTYDQAFADAFCEPEHFNPRLACVVPASWVVENHDGRVVAMAETREHAAEIASQ